MWKPPIISEDFSSHLLSGSREQPGVGGVGGEEEGRRTFAWRGRGKALLEGGHLALELRVLASRLLPAPNLRLGPKKLSPIYSWFPKI